MEYKTVDLAAESPACRTHIDKEMLVWNGTDTTATGAFVMAYDPSLEFPVIGIGSGSNHVSTWEYMCGIPDPGVTSPCGWLRVLACGVPITPLNRRGPRCCARRIWTSESL